MIKVKTDQKIIDRILNKAVEQVLSSKEALEKELKSGRRLNVYQGFDPTAPTLHIGHTVMMRKLEDFRKLGHNVTFLVGDFTARIGDPSDKSSTRQKLTKEEVEENMKLYVDQASKIIDVKNKENPVNIKYNSEWHEKLNFGDILELTYEFTVQQMLKRDMFRKRLKEEKPIHISEFMYPIMQGYDAVMMETDVELGGNDQLFNMLAGRDMVKNHLKKEKFVITGKLLTTNDGAKMGKTTGNMVTMIDTPNDIYGKIMASEDNLIIPSFEILTSMELKDVKKIEVRLNSGENPMTLKKELALLVTSEITSKEEAKNAQKYFEEVFQKKEISEDIPEVHITENSIKLNDLIFSVKLANSKSQARRLVEQGAVKINGETQNQWDLAIDLQSLTPITLKVGRRLIRIYHQT
jgi:tyrosyl-tRNA synthetase